MPSATRSSVTASYGGSVEHSALSAAATRPFLHAERLGFRHPSTGEHVSFDAPLPADLVAILDIVAGQRG